MFFGRKPKPDAAPPFQAVVRTDNPGDESAEHLPDVAPSSAHEEGWSVDDIEAAYLRALEVAESAEVTESADEDDSVFVEPLVADNEAESPRVANGNAAPIETAASEDVAESRRVTPRQIIEALLFVGGRPLTSRQLADVLGGSSTPDVVDDTIADLNTEYSRQQRPYEVRLGEGGYRLDLKSSFEKVRARVFGFGPREVKLAQNALEVLALVAYQQPISRVDVDESGIKGSGGLLRQLLRRELITLDRGIDDAPDVYRTTGRFLELFGLRSLAELPRPEAVDIR